MVLFIPIFAILFWFALFVFALALWATVWVVGGLIVGLADLTSRLTGRKRSWTAPRKPAANSKQNAPRVASPASVPRAPERPKAETPAASEIWPKWNAAHRRYVDGDKSLWQEQFDALNSRK